MAAAKQAREPSWQASIRAARDRYVATLLDCDTRTVSAATAAIESAIASIESQLRVVEIEAKRQHAIRDAREKRDKDRAEAKRAAQEKFAARVKARAERLAAAGRRSSEVSSNGK